MSDLPEGITAAAMAIQFFYELDLRKLRVESIRLLDSGARDASLRLPPAVFSSFWLEAFLVRALDHDNDSVQKFVLGQLM